MEKAIIKARDGGFYEGKIYAIENDCIVLMNENGGYGKRVTFSEVLLDPLFWQALGKAEGWNDVEFEHTPEWEHYWHGFIDHLIEGKDADSFFNNLLK